MARAWTSCGALEDGAPTWSACMLTAFASADTAVEAMRLGAVDYLTKPFDVADLKQRVARYWRPTLNETRVLPRRAAARRPGSSTSPAAAGDARRLSPGGARGPHRQQRAHHRRIGHRQGVVARAIHLQSPRQRPARSSPSTAARFTETLLESELFGHVKGAFTGAADTKTGLLESADRGTLFLDEIGEMSLGMQVKLLRVLQERASGASAARRSSRPTSASSQPPTAISRRWSARGKFREDLFYRINVISVACRRCASAPKTFRPRRAVRPALRRAHAPPGGAIAPDAARCSWPIAGRATCASSRTSSSAAWRSTDRPSSRPRACRRTCRGASGGGAARGRGHPGVRLQPRGAPATNRADAPGTGAEAGRRGASEGRRSARNHVPPVPLPGQEVPAEIEPGALPGCQSPPADLTAGVSVPAHTGRHGTAGP